MDKGQKRHSVTALGELLIDFAAVGSDRDGYPALQAHPGGAPANFLAALAKHGIETALLGKVGQDAFGTLLTDTLRKTGIGTEGIVADSSVFTTLAFVTLDEQGDRSFSFSRKPGADTCLRTEEVKLSLIDRAEVFHFGTLSLTHEPSASATRAALAYAKAGAKLVSFDPNLRPPLWDDLKRAKEQILWGLQQADIVKLSEEEAWFLFELGPEAAAEKLLSEYSISLCFVTCGENGALAACRAGMVHVPPLQGIQAVDTTGAGDIFFGSALARLLEDGRAIGELTVEKLEQITRYACTFAGLSVTRPGGISSVPELSEAMARL